MDKYMEMAIKLAKKAYKHDDVPVGAVIISHNKVISKAYNKKFVKNDVTAHAEILALQKACKKKKTTYLNDCTIYITLEPCTMCADAIKQAHINTIIYCAESPKYGALHLNNSFNVKKIESDEYVKLLKKFFADKR